jgi:prophage regulatory protein
MPHVDLNADAPARVQRIIRLRDLPTYCGLQRTVIEGLIAAGQFPKPIKLSARANGWLEDEVAAWQRARIAARDGDAK